MKNKLYPWKNVKSYNFLNVAHHLILILYKLLLYVGIRFSAVHEMFYF